MLSKQGWDKIVVMSEIPVNVNQILEEAIQRKDEARRTTVSKALEMQPFLKQLHQEVIPPLSKCVIKTLIVEMVDQDKEDIKIAFTQLDSTGDISTSNDMWAQTAKLVSSFGESLDMDNAQREMIEILVAYKRIMGFTTFEKLPEETSRKIQDEFWIKYSKRRKKLGQPTFYIDKDKIHRIGDPPNSRNIVNPDDVILSIATPAQVGAVIHIPQELLLETEVEQLAKKISKTASQIKPEEFLPHWEQKTDVVGVEPDVVRK